MVFDTFTYAHWALLGSVFVIAALLGAVVHQTHFCTMGAVADIVNMRDWRRMRAWMLAMAVAVLAVGLLEAVGLIDVDGSMPPYRRVDFAWAGYLLGGLLFGIGMTLGSGCGNKTVVRIGTGSLKALLVAATLGGVAYFMIHPLPGLDLSLRHLLFGWVSASAIPHRFGQDLGSLLGGEAGPAIRPFLAVLLAAALFYAVFRCADFRRSRNHVIGGAGVGLCVVAVWVVTSNIAVDTPGGEPLPLSSYAAQWSEHHESDDGRPANPRLLAPQGINFVGPLAQTTGFSTSGFDARHLTVGVAVVTGVVFGAFLWAVINGTFRVEWFASRGDFANHLLGGALMGIGGPLSMGCTFGQGITGLSTLALSAPLTLAGLILGSALTMRVLYYRLLYEGEASFAKAMISGLVDLRLLPASMRRLEG